MRILQKFSLNTKVISAEFMKEHNSFLIPIDGLEPVKEGVFTDQTAARAVGRQGSLDVRSKYNPATVAHVLRARPEQI